MPEARFLVGHGQLRRERARACDAAVLRRRGTMCWSARRSSRAAWTFHTPTRSSSTMRRNYRAGAAVPAARARRPLDAARVCLSAVPSRQHVSPTTPSSGSKRSRRLPSLVQASASPCAIWRSAVSATCWGRSRPVISAPWALICTPGCWHRRSSSASKPRPASCAMRGGGSTPARQSKPSSYAGRRAPR